VWNDELPQLQTSLDNVDISEEQGDSIATALLFAACQAGNNEIVDYLMATFDPDVEARNQRDQTPIIAAAEFGSWDTVKWLRVQYRARIAKRARRGQSVITIAAHKKITMMQWLLTEGKCNISRKIVCFHCDIFCLIVMDV
jgi:Ankyrin repeats (3 copies)